MAFFSRKLIIWLSHFAADLVILKLFYIQVRTVGYSIRLTFNVIHFGPCIIAALFKCLVPRHGHGIHNTGGMYIA